MSTPTAHLTSLLSQLNATPPPAPSTASSLLSQAKLLLLQLRALTPATTPSPTLLPLARAVYEAGALSSLRASDAPSFRRYVQQLAPYYALPPTVLAPSTDGGRSKVTGLYLLLLLTEGEYSEFHSELEGLSSAGSKAPEEDDYLGYPIRLERWLMEGSYDRVWQAVSGKGKEMKVPCEEFGVFSDTLTRQIRNEIASSSERAYPSLPLSSTKSLLFLDSEGAVIDFARARGWTVRDGTIYFPSADAATQEAGEEAQQEKASQRIIDNALGYARQLETIV
ncbi:SAC3/GANP/Nin1/mts3/eIF-3 p25 family-domain-containing protein [Podospora conica]|nr:SAC3/GANP/Nin1/mts3/eIF-3 p25 family-domain-containing protein [Schizothecium conicum]